MAARKPANTKSKLTHTRTRTRTDSAASRAAARRVAALLAAIADAEERLQCLQSYADRLRETADQVASGEINYAHGWNRVRKIANEIASAKQ